MIVYAQQFDTIDSIAYRYFGEQSVDYLAQILELNPNLQGVILAEHQAVQLPAKIVKTQSNTLKLWD